MNIFSSFTPKFGLIVSKEKFHLFQNPSHFAWLLSFINNRVIWWFQKWQKFKKWQWKSGQLFISLNQNKIHAVCSTRVSGIVFSTEIPLKFRNFQYWWPIVWPLSNSVKNCSIFTLILMHPLDYTKNNEYQLKVNFILCLGSFLSIYLAIHPSNFGK